MVKEAFSNIPVPDRKVQFGAVAGAITAIAAWGIGEFTPTVIPPEIAVAASTVLVFILQYTIPNR